MARNVIAEPEVQILRFRHQATGSEAGPSTPEARARRKAVDPDETQEAEQGDLSLAQRFMGWLPAAALLSDSAAP